MVSRLALHLLGPPRIEREGVPIKVDTRKAIALLAYLGVTGQSQRRSSLINLLWPEYDRTRGRAVLRRTLYALQKALTGTWLDVDREEIGLNVDADIWVDVTQFRRQLAQCTTHGHPPTEACAACVAPLTEAVALYRGDFLSGFGLKDSVNFDDWAFFQADVLRGELAGALERLVRWHTAQRQFEPAVGYARRRLALDPLDEEAHCELMQLYAWSGQRSAALRQYEECVAVLDDQLGVSPEEATTGLYEAIKAGRAPPPPSPEHPVDLRAPPPSFLDQEGVLERPVFVARQRELVQLAGFLDAALAGQSRVVFVTGDAGCGKTALLQEFAWRAQTAHPDLVVAWGHGNAHTGVGDPYLPFREVLDQLTGDVEAQFAAGAMTGEQARRLWYLLPLAVEALVEAGPDLVDLFVPGPAVLRRAAAFTPWPGGSARLAQLKELVRRKATTPGNPNLQQTALFEQYTRVLRALARQKPLLLALDDLQWADGGSVNLLFHLGRRMEGSPLLIVGAYRPAEVALGRQPSPFSTEPAWDEARGDVGAERGRHPLEPVVHEFKRVFGEIEVNLERAAGRQFVDAFLDSEPNRLDDAFRETLYQHTLGYPLFTVELLRGMQDRGDLVRDREGRWVQGAALDWEALPARVEAVIAERIACLPERLQDLLTVASVEGETFTAEVLAEVQAADERETVGCLSDTLDRRHRLVSARGVLRVGGRRLSQYRFRHILFQKHLYHSLDSVERVHLHQAVGTALESMVGERAEHAAIQLARHFQEAGIVDKAVDYLRQAGERARRLYANQDAIGTLRRALELLAEVPSDAAPGPWRQESAIRLYESLGDVLEWTGEHEEARAAYQAALGHVPPGDRFVEARLHRKAGNVWRLQHRHEEARQAYDRAERALGQGVPELAPEGRQEWVQIQLERMWLYYWLGEWREISELAEQARPVINQCGAPRQRISFLLSLGSIVWRRDRYVVSEEIIALCREALDISKELEDAGEIAWARFGLGFNQLWHGDFDEAEQQMRAALALAEQTGDIVHQSRCLTYLTVLYRKRGEVERAREYASRSLAVATAGEMLEYVGMAKANLAWVAWRAQDLPQAEENGKAACTLWQSLPASHSSAAFQWTALWPLIGVALAENRPADAIESARALLQPTQQRLPDRLTSVVEAAIAAWDGGGSETARDHLGQALRIAEESRFL